MALNLIDGEIDCEKLAEKFGAFAAVPDHGCCPVAGKAVIIAPDIHSIQEGFEIANFNMHTSGVKPPVPTPEFLQGPVNVGKNAGV